MDPLSLTAERVTPLRLARSQLRRWLSRRPALYYPMLSLRSPHSPLVVRRDTELVVEGFPRSGNTFTVAWLQESAPDLRIAHHLHAFAQVRRGLKWNIPVIVLVREPTATVTSLLVREASADPLLALRAYIRFYHDTIAAGSAIMVADFEDVTSRLGLVMARANMRFGTSFPEATPDDHAVDRVFRRIESLNQTTGSAAGEHGVARPSPARQAAKVRAAERLNGLRERHLLNDATQIYLALRSSARLDEAQA